MTKIVDGIKCPICESELVWQEKHKFWNCEGCKLLEVWPNKSFFDKFEEKKTERTNEEWEQLKWAVGGRYTVVKPLVDGMKVKIEGGGSKSKGSKKPVKKIRTEKWEEDMRQKRRG